MAEAKVANEVLFPPYGRMAIEFDEAIPDDGQPKAWDSKVEWRSWREAVLQLITTVLWPRYEPRTGRWIGDASALMTQITRADFEMFLELREYIGRPAAIDPAAPVSVSHLDFYKMEDDPDFRYTLPDGQIVTIDRSVDATLRRYLGRTVNEDVVEDLALGYFRGMRARGGALHRVLKRDLQRPRPFQTATLLRVFSFTHYQAKSGVTPAIISGHCYLGVMGGVAAFYRARELGCSEPAMQRLAQHTVDIGDRRVFAGVHYASDNLAAWLVALMLCTHVCPDDMARTWLWHAIRDKSAVFAAIDRAVRAGAADAHRRPLEMLRRLGDDASVDIKALLGGEPPAKE